MTNKKTTWAVLGAATVVLVVAALLIGPQRTGDRTEQSGSSAGDSSRPTPPTTSFRELMDAAAAAHAAGTGNARDDSPGEITEAENSVYLGISLSLASKDNPANRPVPERFLDEERDEGAFKKWSTRTMLLGNDYQAKAFDQAAERHGVSAEKVRKTYDKVYDFRQRHDLPLR